MIQYDKFQFAAPPRTGSTWFLRSAAAVGWGEGAANDKHRPWTKPSNGQTLRISMVRHPVDWLMSYWAAIYPGSTGLEAVDVLRRCNIEHTLPNFNSFLQWYLSECPGQVLRIYQMYESDMCLRLEDAPWNFIELADQLGARVGGNMVTTLLKAIGRPNQSKALPEVNKWLHKRVLEEEHALCDRYEYDF